MRYHLGVDGDVIAPNMTGYRLACCDCGLVHNLDFAIVRETKKLGRGKVEVDPVDDPDLFVIFSPTRNNRATAAKRAWIRRKSALLGEGE